MTSVYNIKWFKKNTELLYNIMKIGNKAGIGIK